MRERPVLIAGRFRQARPAEAPFRAADPATGELRAPEFPVSAWEDVEEALESGLRAASVLADLPGSTIAAALDQVATRLLERADDLVSAAAGETALPAEPRLRSSELPRTVGQLHQAAEAARDGSWRRLTIDTKLNIRSRLAPLGGPVAVLGPNNFPFAYNAAGGGDFAAALAAGNPVLAKAHPDHPETTFLLAEIVARAFADMRLPEGTFQMIYHIRSEDGFKLVADRRVGATAFTGSRKAGLRLKAAADAAGRPIYLEMSGINPVILLPGALRQRGEALASEWFASCNLGAGQFCTKPGLVLFLEGRDADRFQAAAVKAFRSSPPGFLLGAGVQSSLRESVDRMVGLGAALLTGGHSLPPPGFRFENTLLHIEAADFLHNPADFQREAFGTAALLVSATDENELADVVLALEGTLAASIYSAIDPGDERIYGRLAPPLRVRCGRLLNDKMPTGLAVVPAMVHGGPYPASGHPGFTSVGMPASLTRFAALRAYDNVRPDRLPVDLRDEPPPSRPWRLIDGALTREAVGSR